MVRFEPAEECASLMMVWLIKGFDFEKIQQYSFSIAANDGFYTSEPMMLVIKILPVNEHGPNFHNSRMNIDINENTLPYSFHLPIFATDSDMDSENSTHGVIALYYLSPPSPYFSIVRRGNNGTENVLTNLVSIDYEMIPVELNVTIQAIDGAGRIAEEPLHVTFNIIDTNDEVPQFSLASYKVEVMENAVGNVLQVKAVDNDRSLQYSSLSYEIKPPISPFAINNNGYVYLTRPLNYESDAIFYNISVIAKDIDGQSDSVVVEVTLLDENEYYPQFNSTMIEVSVSEDTAPESVLLNTTASDSDGSEVYGMISHYTISPITSVFDFNGFTGVLSLGSAPLDSETQVDNYKFEVTAFDKGGLSGNVTVIIHNNRCKRIQPRI